MSDARQDFLHKLTTRLVRENQLIGVEDLSVKNLVKNHKLALSISDAAWGEAIRQLEYKCAWYGRTFVKIERWFPSSKRCSNCGYIIDKLPLNIREWDCPKCRVHHDRDENAGKNILATFSECAGWMSMRSFFPIFPLAQASILRRILLRK